jgi:predicted metal-dependent hydrolase
MQKNENIVEYKGIGAVRYIQNRRARNISIRINQAGEVRVTVPGFVSRKRAEKFLFSKREWVLSRLSAMKARDLGERGPGDGEMILVRGIPVKIELRKGENFAEEALWRILREEARAYLPGRVKKLSADHGFNHTGVTIRKMKSRWGSCTHAKRINLNSWLMMLPDYLSDYVILHELVHTRYPHHGPEFWRALDEVTGGRSKELRKELRKKRIMSIYPENQFSGESD